MAEHFFDAVVTVIVAVGTARSAATSGAGSTATTSSPGAATAAAPRPLPALMPIAQAQNAWQPRHLLWVLLRVGVTARWGRCGACPSRHPLRVMPESP